jgi:hypothetical protein
VDTEQQKKPRNKQGGVGRNGNLIPQRAGEPSRNPHGRPKGSISIVTYVRRALKEKCDQPGANGRTWAELLGKSLIANAIKGNGTAIKEVLSRIDGPIPTVLEGEDGKLLKIIVEHVMPTTTEDTP